MTGIPGRALLTSTAMILALSACEDGDIFGSTTTRDAPAAGETDASPAAETRTETREVERPDVFSVTESGLWDGRPSLGGVWVAHPDVVDPDRVRIENTDNGRVVNGALFRRERENPGPRIQVSSDAAEELGILAGKPTTLALVVVREEEVEIAPIIAPPSDAEPEVDGAAEAEVAALDAATVDDLAPASAEATGEPLEAPQRQPRRQGFFATLFGTGASQTEPVQTDVITENGDVVTTTTAAAPGVETSTLDTVAVASAAIDEAEASAAPVETSRPAANGLRNPYVQVGLFSVEENAAAAATSLRSAGIVPSVVSGTNGDRQFWRVLVGPMSSADEQATMLKQVRDLGYSDAFLAPS